MTENSDTPNYEDLASELWANQNRPGWASLNIGKFIAALRAAARQQEALSALDSHCRAVGCQIGGCVENVAKLREALAEAQKLLNNGSWRSALAILDAAMSQNGGGEK